MWPGGCSIRGPRVIVVNWSACKKEQRLHVLTSDGNCVNTLSPIRQIVFSGFDLWW